MKRITIPKDDYGFKLPFTIQDSDGTVVDLSTYTMTLKVWKPGVPDTLIVTGTCSTEDAASASAGKCYYSVTTDASATADFHTVGRYHAEIELTKTGVIESTEIFGITIVESG